MFNRNSDKKKIIWSFISSFILFGIGCGLVFVSALNFDVLGNNETMLKVEKTEHDMRDDLVLFPYHDLKYVESDINNIKKEYSVNKYCEINERMDNNEEIMMWVICNLPNPTKVARELIKNINDKKLFR